MNKLFVDSRVTPVETEIVKVDSVTPYLGLHQLNEDAASILRPWGNLDYFVRDQELFLTGNRIRYNNAKGILLATLDGEPKEPVNVQFRYDPGNLFQFYGKRIITASGTQYTLDSSFKLHARSEHEGRTVELVAGVTKEDKKNLIASRAAGEEQARAYMELCSQEPAKGLFLAILAREGNLITTSRIEDIK